MKSKKLIVTLMAFAQLSPVYAGPTTSYQALLHRYERQIQQQERQLESLKANLSVKEKEAQTWQAKAETSKKQWKSTGGLVEKTQATLKSVREQWSKTRILVQTAQWAIAEKNVLREAAQREMLYLSTALYKDEMTQTATQQKVLEPAPTAVVLSQLTALSTAAQMGLQEARRQELRWRQEEEQWRQQEARYRQQSEKYRTEQQMQWSHWQEALRRKQKLEEEQIQMEQSAQALRVMLEALRSHRDQTKEALKEEKAVPGPSLSRQIPLEKASLPWPVRGHVIQTFGRHYSEDLHQLQISNGIKIQSQSGGTVRCIQGGKVLYARPFQHYGQLVIVQHAKDVASVYGSLGEIQVQEGQMLSTLDIIGSLDSTGSFYFEMRHQEEPIDPLVWLAPNLNSDISLRRTSP